MDAYYFAREFAKWLTARWEPDLEEPPGTPLEESFESWVGEFDLIGKTGGNHVLVLQVFIVAAAWLIKDPSIFGRQGPYIDSLMGQGHDHHDATGELPGFLGREWDELLFYRKYGSRENYYP